MEMNIHWYSGWASDLEKMQLNFSPSFAKHHHRFYSFSELRENSSRPPADLIIAWSVGAHFIPTNFSGRVLLLNPALDFCNPALGWKPKVLQRMILQIQRKPHSVLESFAVQLAAEKKDTQLWLSLAQKMDVPLLVEGLEQLCQPASLSFLKQSKTLCLQGEQDQICSPSLNRKLCEENNISCQTIPQKGHEIFSTPWMKKIETLL